MEGDALEMKVREPEAEADTGKVSKHQSNAMQCNDKYAISGKPEWGGGVSCGFNEHRCSVNKVNIVVSYI